MFCKLQAVVVGDRFDAVIFKGSDDRPVGFIAGFSFKFDQLVVAGFSLVKAEDIATPPIRVSLAHK